jgi:hypothetical protein
MSERTARGYMVQSTVAYIEKSYDEASRKRIYESIDPRVREVMRSATQIAWYPVQDLAVMFRAIAAHHQRTDGKVREALVGVGRSIGETATSTFLKIVLRILTPARFASKMPDFWQRDHRCGSLSAPTCEPENRRIVAVLKDVEGYDCIGPVAAGFVLFAFEHLGLKNVRVSFDWTLEDAGPSEVAYTFTWE